MPARAEPAAPADAGDGASGGSTESPRAGDRPVRVLSHVPEYQGRGVIGEAWVPTRQDGSSRMNIPESPNQITTEPSGETGILVRWRDMSTNDEGFRVRWQRVQAGQWVLVETRDIQPGQSSAVFETGYGTHRFQVASFNDRGTSAYSNFSAPRDVTPPPPPPPPPPPEPQPTTPPAPTGLTSTDTGNRSVNLAWTDNSSDEIRFDVERLPAWFGGTQTLAPNVTTFLDPSGVGQFSYRVRSVNGVGPSAWTGWSTVVVAETVPVSPAGLSIEDAGNELDVLVDWVDNSNNETGFIVERQRWDGTAWTSTTTMTVGADVIDLTDHAGAGTLRYRVCSTNSAGDSAWTTWAEVTVSDGWTHFSPSVDTRVVYVSSSQGNDANNGLSEATPKRTILAAENLMRQGYPDWILLKCGDTFTDVFSNSKGGRSLAEPMLFSYYGAGSRPILTPASSSAMSVGRNGPGNLAIVGLHLRANEAGSASSGIAILCGTAPTRNYLIEDCIIEGFKDNLNIQGGINGSFPIENMTIRRCVVRNSWSTAGHSQGAYINSVHGLMISECVFDHNGWHQTDRSDATIFNHNLYLATKNENVTVRKCLISRAASHGLQLRSGGEISNNVFVQNPISLQLGGGDANPATHTYGVTGNVTGNVILEAINLNPTTPRAQGIYVMNIGRGGTLISDNIVANALDQTSTNLGAIFAFGAGAGCGVGYNDTTITSNIFYASGFASLRRPADSPTPPSAFNSVEDNVFEGNVIHVIDRPSGGQDSVHLDFATTPQAIAFRNNQYWSPRSASQQFRYANLYQSFAAWQTSTEDSGSTLAASNFPDPTRSVSTYLVVLGETGGLDRLVDLQAQRGKLTWPRDLEPLSLLNYVRAGFGKTPY